MKTKDIIKALKEADPKGNTHAYIYGEGGAIHYVDSLPGYYDGSYEYLKWNGKDSPPGKYAPDEIVISRKGTKIAIHTVDWEDMAFDKQKVTLDGLKDKEFEKRIKDIRGERADKRAIERHTLKVLNKIKEGYVVVQPASKKIGMCNVMVFLKGDNKKDIDQISKGNRCYKSKNTVLLCQGDCQAVLKSELFKPTKRKDFIYWNLVFYRKSLTK